MPVASVAVGQNAAWGKIPVRIVGHYEALNDRMIVIVQPSNHFPDLFEMLRPCRRHLVAALLDAPNDVLVVFEFLDDAFNPSPLIGVKASPGIQRPTHSFHVRGIVIELQVDNDSLLLKQIQPSLPLIENRIIQRLRWIVIQKGAMRIVSFVFDVASPHSEPGDNPETLPS